MSATLHDQFLNYARKVSQEKYNRKCRRNFQVEFRPNYKHSRLLQGITGLVKKEKKIYKT